MSTTNPRVSAIVPSHGHRQFLSVRLESITGQSRPPDELVIIDDGSSDGSAEWLRAWRSPLPLRLECRPSASGNPFAIWNAGADHATGDWLWIAESDDSCRPEFLATLLAVAKQHPEAAMVFCQSELIDVNGTPIGSFADYTSAYNSESWRNDFTLSGASAVFQHLLARNSIPNVSACLLSRRAWLAACGADSSLNLCGDWLTYARLLLHGPLVFLAAPLNQHRHHASTQRIRTARTEYVRQGYEARRQVAELHAITGTEREFARRFAWNEAMDALGVPAEQLPRSLDAGARAAARAFDPQFDRRATDPAARAWDHCDAFFHASGAFALANQRRLPIVTYGSWTTFAFQHGTGRIRFDPIARPSRCALRRLALIDPDGGQAIWVADARSGFAGLTANAGVQLSVRDGALFIVSAHEDPQVFVPEAVSAGRQSFNLVVEMRYELE